MGGPPERLDKIGQYKNKVKKSRNCMSLRRRTCFKWERSLNEKNGVVRGRISRDFGFWIKVGAEIPVAWSPVLFPGRGKTRL